MTIDVKSIRLHIDEVINLLDDYCQVVCHNPDCTDSNCFMCPVRRAILEAQSTRLYLSLMSKPDMEAYEKAVHRGGTDDSESNSSRR